MASGFDFNIDGLEILQRDLEIVIRNCPAQAEDALLNIAKEFKAAAKKKANTELKHVKRKGKNKNKAINAKWGSKVIDESVGMTALIWNSAKHFHLIENGHNLVKGGRIIDFVPGKHIMEGTRNDFQSIVPERFKEMIDDILERSDLD